jgi:negative modulator of initiation of replication
MGTAKSEMFAMPNIEIDDDLYSYLLKKAVRIGETASEIIRREIKHSTDRNGTQSLSQPAKGESAGYNGATNDEKELLQFLESPAFQSQKQVVDRFLFLLAWLREHHDERFKVVVNIKGRSRKYFALTEQELHASGTSTNPKPIPKSGYWVVTNNDTPKKQEIIRKLMQSLRYGFETIRRVESALV